MYSLTTARATNSARSITRNDAPSTRAAWRSTSDWTLKPSNSNCRTTRLASRRFSQPAGHPGLIGLSKLSRHRFSTADAGFKVDARAKQTSALLEFELDRLPVGNSLADLRIAVHRYSDCFKQRHCVRWRAAQHPSCNHNFYQALAQNRHPNPLFNQTKIVLLGPIFTERTVSF